MGVIFLNLTFIISRQGGTYFSNRIVRLAFSDCTSLVSIHELTYLHYKTFTIVSALIKGGTEIFKDLMLSIKTPTCHTKV